MRSHWSNRWAFIMATAGSAVGLGNIWKFPYMTGTNGGSAFVLVYLLCVALIGLPLMMTEIMLGRRAQRNPVDGMAHLAAEAGGNCELTQPGKTVVAHGITICGPLNLPAELSWHASTLYSRNLTSFVLAFWKDGQFQLDLEDEIIRDALVTHQGEVRRPAGG